KVAGSTEKKIEVLLLDAGIIRNKQKIIASINNAQRFLEVQKQYGSFDKYIWQFVSYKPIVNHWEESGQIPAKSHESDVMSKDLQSKGFKFVGSTICYAFMQAAGLVNDHLISCKRHKAVQNC